MKRFLIYIILLSFLINLSYQKSQIFHEQNTCEISTEFKHKNKIYLVPAEIVAKNENLLLIISLCTKNAFVSGGQSNFSDVSLYNKTTKLWVNNTAHLKPYEVSKVNEGIEISLGNEIKCNNDDNYQISIILGKYQKVGLNIVDDCMVKIELTSSDYDPPCMKHVSSKWFIDLSSLRRMVISCNNDKDIFKIALCGKVTECKNEAGCKISGNETTIIGSLEKQRVKFSSNIVSVFSSTVEKPKKTMEIFLRCNWNVEYFSKPKLMKETKYEFEVQSSFGCVKIPQSCIIKENLLTYNLTGLTANNGTIVTNSSILFHICGDLELKGPKNNRCHSQKSQVCEISGGNYLNRGSIPIFEVTEDKNIKVTFNSGEVCHENETYSTVLDLNCSLTESSPTFVSEEGCVTKISWETQKACPKFQINKKSCSFHSIQGDVNLAELYRENDYIKLFSPSQKLIFNICGRLHSACTTSEDVSACFIDGNVQKIIGWNSPNLSFIDGKLQLKYTGEKCISQNKPYSLTINMICSFVKSSSFLASLTVGKVDDCTFTAIVVSSTACLKHWEIKNCTVDNYNLSSLIKRNENYEIKDDNNSNITYFLNLCAPVIPKENLLFSSGSMVYMQNSSIALITKRFTSLGALAGPTIEKDTNKLVVNAIGSSVSSKIIFECSDEEGSPTIKGNNEHQFEFKWKTKHACTIMKRRDRCLLTTGNISIEVPGEPIELKMNQDHIYYFSLCLDQYRFCRNVGLCVTEKLSKKIQLQNGFIQYILNDSDHSILRTVNLSVECDPNSYFNFFSAENGDYGHVDVIVKTKLFCKNAPQMTQNDIKNDLKEGDIYVSIGQTENQKDNVNYIFSKSNESIEHNNYAEQTKNSSKTLKEIAIDVTSHPLEESKKLKKKKSTETSSSLPNSRCKLNVHGKQLDLNDLEFTVDGAMYIFNFNGSSPKCSGFICKNGDNILSFIEKCPDVSYEGNSIILSYFTEEFCHVVEEANSTILSKKKERKKRIVEVSLSCDYNEGITTEVSEANCKIVIHHSSSKICLFFSNPSIIILVVIFVILLFILLLCVILYLLYKKNYLKKCSYQKVDDNLIDLIDHHKIL